ncbi:MAG: insulinase family protein [Clostridia bacterium]|nr:insulinase family protein [Clostridia bacterium]
MINRNIAPQTIIPNKVEFLQPEELLSSSSEGFKMFGFYSPNAPVVKLDLIFNAGVEYQTKSLQAVFANSLIKEAPIGKNPDEVAEYFDFYGSYIEAFAGIDTAGLRLYVPSKHFVDVIQLLIDIISNPLLPEQEFELMQKKYFQSIKNNLKKTKYVAMRGLNLEFFGETHPLGYMVEPDDVYKVTYDDVVDFVRKYYSLDNCTAIISGDYNVDMVNSLRNAITTKEANTQDKVIINPVGFTKNIKVYNFDDAVQSSIYGGIDLGNPSDEDRLYLNVLNTVFGGYFGSRLMKNIREDKGYTYGIGSFISETKSTVLLKIVSDVGVDVTNQAIAEIYKEIDLLKTETISAEELNLVKNYMIGDLITSLDGVIPNAMFFEKLLAKGRTMNYIDAQVKAIMSITPQIVLEYAQKYLNTEKMCIVVAGKN